MKHVLSLFFHPSDSFMQYIPSKKKNQKYVKEVCKEQPQ